jgi:hypothetical protein
MSMKNSSDTIGNRTRDRPVCSAVPQSVRHQQRAPNTQFKSKVNGRSHSPMFNPYVKQDVISNCIGSTQSDLTVVAFGLCPLHLECTKKNVDSHSLVGGVANSAVRPVLQTAVCFQLDPSIR